MYPPDLGRLLWREGRGFRLTNPAILRNLQILCESTQRLTEASKKRHPEVEWPAISGLRNVVVHDYFAVDWETIWTIIQRDLPILERAVRELLEATPTPS